MKQAELNKLLNEVLRELARAHQWKFSQGFLFKSTPQLLFSVIINSQVKQHQLSCLFTYKWLAFDDLFWKIVKLDENAKRPLSFRVNGAWTVPMTTISEADMLIAVWDAENPRLKANEMITDCALAAEQISQEIQGLDDNLRVIEKYPRAARTIFLERFLTSMLNKAHIEAAGIVQERLAQGDSGGFLMGAKSFYAFSDEFLQGAPEGA